MKTKALKACWNLKNHLKNVSPRSKAKTETVQTNDPTIKRDGSVLSYIFHGDHCKYFETFQR